jgi:hypothetical protein
VSTSNSNRSNNTDNSAHASADSLNSSHAANSSRRRRWRLKHSLESKAAPFARSVTSRDPLLPTPAMAPAKPPDREPQTLLVGRTPESGNGKSSLPGDAVHLQPSSSTDAKTRVKRSRISLRARLGAVREKAREAARRRRRARREGFRWYEREWDGRFWVSRMGITPRAVLTLAVVTVVSLFAFLIAARAAGRAGIPVQSGKATDANPIIIQQEGSGGGIATPALPTYVVGVWVSNMSPPASGSLGVYVRVTKNVGGITNEPVANVPVTIASPNGRARGVVKTNSSGLATFTFFYGQSPGFPVYITATATIGKQPVSSTTDFVVA